jgi:hypothetical protein
VGEAGLLSFAYLSEHRALGLEPWEGSTDAKGLLQRMHWQEGSRFAILSLVAGADLIPSLE